VLSPEGAMSLTDLAPISKHFVRNMTDMCQVVIIPCDQQRLCHVSSGNDATCPVDILPRVRWWTFQDLNFLEWTLKRSEYSSEELRVGL